MATYRDLNASGVPVLRSTVVVSTGAPDADRIASTDATGKFDISLMPLALTGAVVITASEVLNAGGFVNVFDDGGNLRVRNANANNGREAHGFVRVATAAAASVEVFFTGVNELQNSFAPGARTYISGANGAANVTPVVPTNGRVHQMVGISLGTLGIAFDTKENPVKFEL